MRGGITGATAISMQRRAFDARFATRYFVGDGIDIGAGDDSLLQYIELFPRIRSVTDWEIKHGDAQHLAKVEDGQFDFLFSSHCLEHLNDPVEGLFNWIRVVRAGGHLIVSVPDEDLYEQGHWPSIFNKDHKRSFTIAKAVSWSSSSINIIDLLKKTSDLAQPLSINTIDHAYRYRISGDQTHTPLTEASIEFILRKI